MNQFYNHTDGVPAANSRGSTPLIRNEFDMIQQGFDQLPTPSQIATNTAVYAADTGTVNAYAVTLSPAHTAYVAGMEVTFKAGNTSTAACTLNVNGLGVVSIVRPDGTPSVANDIYAGQIVVCRYDGVHFQLGLNANAVNSAASAAAQIAAVTHAATSKATPADNDELGGTDSAAAFGWVRFTFGNLRAQIYALLGAMIAAGTVKATPADADEIAISDSAAANATKSLSWGNVKATLLSTWKDATGGLVGLTLFAINFKNSANTFTSFLTNTNTASRTYTFHDRNGTIADDTDISNTLSSAQTNGDARYAKIANSQFGGTLGVNTNLSAADSGKWFSVTAGVITLPAAAANLRYKFIGEAPGTATIVSPDVPTGFPDGSVIGIGGTIITVARYAAIELVCVGGAWYVQSTSGNVFTMPASASNHAVNLGQFLSALAANGYQKLPNGLIVQWANGVSQSGPNNTQTISFPIAFPTACQHVFVGATRNAVETVVGCLQSNTNSACTITSSNITNGNAYIPRIFAIGY